MSTKSQVAPPSAGSGTSNPTQVRAGCYCRISSDPKDKRAGVDRQREDTAALCEMKGWTLVGYYIDNNRSASSGGDRPEWDRLLTDIKAGKIDAIAAFDQDRNWRVMDEFVDLRRFFKSLGREIPLTTTGQGDVDLYSPTGVLTAEIKTAFSEHEIAMMRVRQRRAARQRAERGIPQWRNAFGYINHEPDPQTAPLVVEAYNALLRGVSISEIARNLNSLGAYGISGKPWSASTMSSFLRAPRNAGLRSHTFKDEKKGEMVTEIVGPGTWPALVDEKTWKRAQAKLNAPGRHRPKTVRKHLLTGALACGKPGCGGHLAGYQTSKGDGAYRCIKCLGVAIRTKDVEPLIYGLVGWRLAREDAVDLLKASTMDETEAAAIRAELNLLHADRLNIGVERARRLLTGEQAKVATEEINDQITKLEARLHDSEMVDLFAGIPVGRPEAVDAVKRLEPTRFRRVIGVLMDPVVMPVGKGSHVFNPDRVQPRWVKPVG
ncbi:recombinase family protein [Mycobacterium simiae]|uniref:recombinase family protein n=1 Tax=Mycobacterium simiae TaxID=1784 RepID=UPI0005CA0B97|nr:recombinase family protein [Mycobacterium simiae]